MALTDEQRAMLQLLLEGGQGYDDIGSLLGIPPDQVRSRARDALREMGGADPDAQVQLSDFLLGQADPIGRADAVRHLQNDPEANALANAPHHPAAPDRAAGLAARDPGPEGRPAAPRRVRPRPRARLPPPAPGRPRQARVGRRPDHGAVRGARSSKRGNQMLAIGVAVAALVLIGILAIAGVFGGDDGDGGGGSQTETTAAGGDTGDLTIVRLSPPRAPRARAARRCSRRPRTSPCCRSTSPGWLRPAQDNIYIVWLYNSERAAFPLARDRVTENGNLTGAAAIPTEIIPLLPQFGCIDVSLASTRDTERALQQAVDGQGLPRHTGETVLRGEIPTQAGGTAPTGADSQCAVAPPEATSARRIPDAKRSRCGYAGSSLPGFMIPAGSSRSLTARSASRPSSPTSAAM